MAGERAGKRKRRTAAVLAGILWASVPAAGSNALGAEIGPGVELERRLQGEVSGGGSGRAGMDPAKIDQAGIELFREAQRRQRELADAAADIDGGWSLEYGGLRLYRPGDETGVCRVAAECFEAAIRPYYSDEGRLAFGAYILPESIVERQHSGCYEHSG